MPAVKTIDEIQAGMVLSDDVINPQGLVLIKKGVELTEKHIKVLKRWGINSVSITDSLDTVGDTRPAAEIVQEKLAEISSQIERRFKGSEYSEIMMNIKECVHQYRIDQIKKKFGEN